MHLQYACLIADHRNLVTVAIIISISHWKFVCFLGVTQDAHVFCYKYFQKKAVFEENIIGILEMCWRPLAPKIFPEKMVGVSLNMQCKET